MHSVSVIIPIYNAARDLPRCFATLDAQTCADVQVVLVNDGSTDDSLSLCRAYAAQNANAIELSQANAGAAAARNAGLDAADGAYIAFFDADDAVSPDMLQTLLALCEANDCDVAQCGLLAVKPDATAFAFRAASEPPLTITGVELIGRIYGADYASTVVLWNKLYRRALWQGLRLPTGHICEDEAILHEVFYRAKRVAITDAALYAYRLSENSVMRQKGSLKRLDILWALERRGDFLRAHRLDELAALNNKLLLTQYLHCYNYLRDECAPTPEVKRKRRELVRAYRAAWRALPASICSRKQCLQYAVYALCPRSERWVSRWLGKRG